MQYLRYFIVFIIDLEKKNAVMDLDTKKINVNRTENVDYQSALPAMQN